MRSFWAFFKLEIAGKRSYLWFSSKLTVYRLWAIALSTSESPNCDDLLLIHPLSSLLFSLSESYSPVVLTVSTTSELALAVSKGKGLILWCLPRRSGNVCFRRMCIIYCKPQLFPSFCSVSQLYPTSITFIKINRDLKLMGLANWKWPILIAWLASNKWDLRYPAERNQQSKGQHLRRPYLIQ